MGSCCSKSALTLPGSKTSGKRIKSVECDTSSKILRIYVTDGKDFKINLKTGRKIKRFWDKTQEIRWIIFNDHLHLDLKSNNGKHRYIESIAVPVDSEFNEELFKFDPKVRQEHVLDEETYGQFKTNGSKFVGEDLADSKPTGWHSLSGPDDVFCPLLDHVQKRDEHASLNPFYSPDTTSVPKSPGSSIPVPLSTGAATSLKNPFESTSKSVLEQPAAGSNGQLHNMKPRHPMPLRSPRSQRVKTQRGRSTNPTTLSVPGPTQANVSVSAFPASAPRSSPRAQSPPKGGGFGALLDQATKAGAKWKPIVRHDLGITLGLDRRLAEHDPAASSLPGFVSPAGLGLFSSVLLVGGYLAFRCLRKRRPQGPVLPTHEDFG